jgi:hypothetical protein
MDIVATISVLAGSAVLLGLLTSIAYEGLTKRKSEKNLVSAFNDKWQKVTVSAH